LHLLWHQGNKKEGEGFKTFPKKLGGKEKCTTSIDFFKSPEERGEGRVKENAQEYMCRLGKRKEEERGTSPPFELYSVR